MSVKMRGSLNFLLALVFGICLLFATSGISVAGNFNGPYIGGQIGSTNYNLDASLGDDAKSQLGIGSSVDGLSADGQSLGIFAGYGYVIPSGVMKDLYLGIEGNYDSTNADFDASIGSGFLYRADMEVDNIYGIKTRIGYVVNNTLPYVLIGWQQTRIEGEINFGNFNKSETETFNGFQIGLGTEYLATENIFVRGQYTHTAYSEETYDYKGYEIVDIEPNSNSFKLAIGYQF